MINYSFKTYKATCCCKNIHSYTSAIHTLLILCCCFPVTLDCARKKLATELANLPGVAFSLFP